MHTVDTYAAPSANEPRTPTTIDRSYAADEPSHIHLPRPGRGTRPEAAAATRTEPRRGPLG